MSSNLKLLEYNAEGDYELEVYDLNSQLEYISHQFKLSRKGFGCLISKLSSHKICRILFNRYSDLLKDDPNINPKELSGMVKDFCQYLEENNPQKKIEVIK